MLHQQASSYMSQQSFYICAPRAQVWRKPGITDPHRVPIGTHAFKHPHAAAPCPRSVLIMASRKNSPALYDERTSGPDATYL